MSCLQEPFPADSGCLCTQAKCVWASRGQPSPWQRQGDMNKTLTSATTIISEQFSPQKNTWQSYTKTFFKIIFECRKYNSFWCTISNHFLGKSFISLLPIYMTVKHERVQNIKYIATFIIVIIESNFGNFLLPAKVGVPSQIYPPTWNNVKSNIKQFSTHGTSDKGGQWTVRDGRQVGCALRVHRPTA